LFVPVIAAGDTPTRRVLIVTSYDLNRPAITIFLQAMRSTLREGTSGRVEFFYEFQENTRISTEKYEEAMVTYMKRKYEGEQFDLVVALGAPALKLVLGHESTLFTGVPKIFYFHDEREQTIHSLWPRVTGVWANFEIARTVAAALTVQPETKRVVIISGSSSQDKFLREEAQRALRSYEGKVEIEYVNDLTMAQLKNKVASLPGNTVVLYLAFFLDSEGNSYSGPEALAMIASSSAAPIYGISDTYMGAGIVGGSLIDFDALGKRTGQLGLRILGGERVQDILPQTIPNVTVFDSRQLRRWNISEKRLPAGSVVQFETPTLWGLYRWYVIAFIAALFIESVLIACLLVTQLRRRQAERETKRQTRLADAEHRRLDEIVSNVPGIVWETLIDPATNQRKTSFISDHVRKMLGYEPQEWLSSASGFALDIIQDEDRERAMRDIEAVVSSGKEGFTQFRWRAKDGRIVWVETHLSPIVDGGQGVIGLRGVTLDINERKLAEETLRHTEEKDRAILNAIPDVMFLQNRDGVYLDYHAKNPTDWFGPPEAFLGKNMRDILPAELSHDFFRCFARTEDAGEAQLLEYKLTINEAEHWFEARMVRSGENILSVIRDITQRVLIEEASRRNEAQLAGIIDSAMDAIITIDENQHIVLFNSAAERIFGCTATAVLGQPIDRFIPERFQAHREHIPGFPEHDVTRRTMGQHGDLYGLKSSGEEFPLEASISQIQLNNEKFYTVILRDITERKRAMDELRQSEERFSKAFRANPQPMSLKTMAEGRYMDVNDSFLEMSGYTRAEVIGRTSLELKIWEIAESRADFIKELQERGSVVNIETKFRTKDGSPRLLLSSAEQLELGGKQCLIIASSDITERKQAEDALRESRARLVLAHQASRMGTFDLNLQTGINIWSPELEAMYGLAPGGFSGSQSAWASLVHPNDRENARATVSQALETGSPVEGEWRVKWPDDSVHWLFGRFQVFPDATGAPERLVGINIDITERKESEEALRVVHEEVTRLKNQLQAENIYLQEEIRLEQHFGEIIGQSDALKYVLFKIEQVAPTDATVLITGETGTGKELVARAIHNASSRRDRPLVKVNCGALSASLIESEFFGHEKGAFTGASGRKIGRFELADGATIFLDEISELPTDLQVKLLRVIQEGEFERLGSSKTIKADVRIIAATNRNLDQDVRKGLFRGDLWYRLNVFPITVPPLRERREDVPLLVEHFVGMFAKKLRKVITSITPETLKSLSQHSWPGNIRELANVIERAVINSHGSVLRIVDDFAEAGLDKPDRENKTLEEIERDYIGRILRETGGRIEGRHGAARILGLNPSTLRGRIAKLRVPRPKEPNPNSVGRDDI
jgi:PAS domain S-box-containing protein